MAGGCATFRPTPYQPAVDGGYGYTDEQLGAGEYRISVSGNAATSAEMLWNHLLFRAAEITLESGHDYFALVPVAEGKLVHIEPAFLMPQFGIGPGAIRGVPMPLFRYEGLPVGVEPSPQLIATATIAFTEGKQSGAENVFNAVEVRERLRTKIAMPTAI